MLKSLLKQFEYSHPDCEQFKQYSNNDNPTALFQFRVIFSICRKHIYNFCFPNGAGVKQP